MATPHRLGHHEDPSHHWNDRVDAAARERLEALLSEAAPKRRRYYKGTLEQAGTGGELWVDPLPLSRATDALRAVMPKTLQDPRMLCFSGGDLAELRRHVGIINEFEQQFFRDVGSAEERDPSRKTVLGVPLVEKRGHLPSDRRKHSHARGGVLCQREKNQLVAEGLRVRGREAFQHIDGRHGVSRHGLDDERIR